jgi:hypothetical protein
VTTKEGQAVEAADRVCFEQPSDLVVKSLIYCGFVKGTLTGVLADSHITVGQREYSVLLWSTVRPDNRETLYVMR